MPITIDTQVINVTISVNTDIVITVPQSLEVIGSGLDTEITNPQEGDELYFDDTDDKWKNRRGKVILTQAEYDALTPDPDVLYYIKEA